MGRTTSLYQNSEMLKAAIGKVRQIADEVSFCKVGNSPGIRVSSYRALVRVAGFFKYTNNSAVLFRGQPQCHGKSLGMKASIFRRRTPPSDADIDAFLNRYRSSLRVDANDIQKLSTEPLLQHYGLTTRWLDVVDSLPHALFFAINEYRTSPSCDDKFATMTYIPSLAKEGVIFVIGIPTGRPTVLGGTAVFGHRESVDKDGKRFHVADLRSLKPSNALRPHAQHGLLVRAIDDCDMWPCVLARIFVPVREARTWISGLALDRESLFPPPIWDGMYGTMLGPKVTAFLAGEAAAGYGPWGDVTRYDFAT